jgi:outer membrane receptor protein involved in Fe transport
VTSLVAILLIACASAAAAQEPQTQPPPSPPAPLQIEETVEVVAVTPVHGLGLPKDKVPANVQVFHADPGRVLSTDVATLLAERVASVHVADVQSGTFQPDVLFRGHVGSPLLGASEGLAAYQNGVRLNEAFGDTINWDALPSGAIASLNVMPGSNPLFGLNALGGALSIRTKDGFGFPGRRASISTGSFGRHLIETEMGGHGSTTAWFVAGSLIEDGGWRDHSRSTVRRLFGDVAWRGSAFSASLNVSAASNDLTGNGPAPPMLLEERPQSVFTHPDRTDNDQALVTFNAQRRFGSAAVVDTVAYVRRVQVGTFNGDAADDDDSESAEGFGALNNRTATVATSAGVTTQWTRTASLAGRGNHAIVGGGFDTARTGFESSSELARLTSNRGTVGLGIFAEDEAVDLRSDTRTASLFATNTWSPATGLGITGAARLNWTRVTLRDQIGTALDGDHSFARVNPSAGITWQISPGVNLYASYAQSSRVPTPVELTCADPEDPCRLPNAFVSDPPLNQIVAGTWETGVRGRVHAMNWSVSAYATTSTSDIVFVSSGTLRGEGHFENIDRTRRRGLEASVDYPAGDRWSVFGAYTIQRATFGTDVEIASRFHPEAEGAEIDVAAGSRLPGVPVHTGKVGVVATLTGGLNIGINLRAQSSQFFRGDEANLLAPLPGFAVLDAQVRHRLTGRAAVVLRVQNLLNANYSTFGLLGDAGLLGEDVEDDPRFQSPGAPRAAWAGLELRF